MRSMHSLHNSTWKYNHPVSDRKAGIEDDAKVTTPHTWSQPTWNIVLSPHSQHSGTSQAVIASSSSLASFKIILMLIEVKVT